MRSVPSAATEVAALVAQHGLRMSRRSQRTGQPADGMEAMNADVWLGDSLGDLISGSHAAVACQHGKFDEIRRHMVVG